MSEKKRTSSPRKTTLSEMLMVRLAPSDLQALDSIRAKLPILSRATLTRELLRRALKDYAESPERLVALDETPKRRRSPV
jgi:hypothetical protein